MTARIKHERIMTDVIANVVLVALIALLITGSLAGTGALAVGGKNSAVYRGNEGEPRVTLMINVYWGTEYIEDILDVFDKYEVKTTFFVGGSWVAKNPEMFKVIVARGHEIGSHGYLHRDSATLSYEANLKEMTLTEDVVAAYGGKAIKLFAPPSGSTGDAMFKAAESRSYTVIMWSRDTIDWRDKDADLVYKRATSDIQNGELILMHPTAHTLSALPKILAYYKTAGLAQVTVSANLLPTET